MRRRLANEIDVVRDGAEADVIRSDDLGANCYLTKPVDVDPFVRVVQSIEDFWLGVVRLPRP